MRLVVCLLLAALPLSFGRLSAGPLPVTDVQSLAPYPDWRAAEQAEARSESTLIASLKQDAALHLHEYLDRARRHLADEPIDLLERVGYSSSTEAESALTEALSDPDSNVVASAANGLRVHGNPDAIDALLAQLDKWSGRARLSIAAALLALGERQESREVLESLLRDSLTRTQTVYRLADELGASADAYAVLSEGFAVADTDGQSPAIGYFMIRAGERYATFGLVVAALRDPRTAFRRGALQGLLRRKVVFGPASCLDALPALQAVAADTSEDWDLRTRARAYVDDIQQPQGEETLPPQRSGEPPRRMNPALGRTDTIRGLRVKSKPVNPEEMKEFEPEPDSHVLEGPWPGGVSHWTMMRLRLRGSDRECIAAVSRESLEVRRLSGDSWQTIARFPFNLFRNDPEFANLGWATGDANNDGWDEVTICSGDTMRVFSWDGRRFQSRTARLPRPIEQVRVGDIDGDKKNELVFFAPDSPPKKGEGSRYHVIVTRWDGARLHTVWDDSTSLGYAHRNMPDDLILIADVRNVGYNQVLVPREQSDVSPTNYDLLAWNKSARRLERTSSFQISDRIVPGYSHFQSAPFVCGEIRACEKSGATYLSAVQQVHGRKYMESHSLLLRMRGDSLVETRTMFKFGSTANCFVNPDGKGIGLLLIWGPMFEDHAMYRFFRL
jgi:hypothetical protein